MGWFIFLVIVVFAWKLISSMTGDKKKSVPIFYDDTPIDPIPEEWTSEEVRIHLQAMRKAVAKLLEEHKDLLDCLIFIGKSDGRLSEKEVEVIAEICLDLTEYKRIPVYRFDTLFREIKRIKTEEFEVAVTRVKMKGEREMQLLTEGAERIIHTQKTLSPGEAYCVETVNKIFTDCSVVR